MYVQVDAYFLPLVTGYMIISCQYTDISPFVCTKNNLCFVDSDTHWVDEKRSSVYS